MYISLANSFDHCTQGGTGDGGDKKDAFIQKYEGGQEDFAEV